MYLFYLLLQEDLEVGGLQDLLDGELGFAHSMIIFI